MNGQSFDTLEVSDPDDGETPVKTDKNGNCSEDENSLPSEKHVEMVALLSKLSEAKHSIFL